MSDLCPKCGISVRKCLNTDACEARAIRAQLEAVTRERDEFRTQALELITERNDEQADKLVAERERNAAHNEMCLARESEARMRAALEGLLRRVDDGSDYSPEHAVSVARAALATPSKSVPRPDATEALRVAMEALEAFDAAHAVCASVGWTSGARHRHLDPALRHSRAALELLRAHVKSQTPIQGG